MSLIADNLKKASQEKAAQTKAPPDFNVMARTPAAGSARLGPLLRFLFLILIPLCFLVYLFSVGAFDRLLDRVSAPVSSTAAQKQAPPAPKPVAAKRPQPMIERTAVLAPVSPQAAVKTLSFIPPAVETGIHPAEKKRTQKIDLQKIPSVQARVLAAADTADIRVLPQAAAVADVGKAGPSPAAPRAITPVPEKTDDNAEATAVFSAVQNPLPEPTVSNQSFQSSLHHFNRALFFQQAREWEKALSSYSEAARLDPDNADTHNNKGVIYKELGQYDRAVDAFLRAVFLKPDYGNAYNNIGVVYYLQKKYDEAVRNYRKAIEIHPDNPEVFNNLAIVYRNNSELAKAQSILNRALSLHPDHPGTHYHLAALYEETGDTASSLHHYRRFLEVGAAQHPTLAQRVKERVNGSKP